MHKGQQVHRAPKGRPVRVEEVKGRKVPQVRQAQPGPPGPPGGAPTPPVPPEYGVASIVVTKGGGLAIPHAAYSISLGSPVADTTGGVFRMTCDAPPEAPCTIAVKAAALSSTDVGGTVSLSPARVGESGRRPGQPALRRTRYCEYADGAGGPAGLVNLTKQAPSATPAYQDVLIDIGGSADCGVAGPGGPVASIVVPEGFYNVHASFAFFTAAPDEQEALRPIDTPRGRGLVSRPLATRAGAHGRTRSPR